MGNKAKLQGYITDVENLIEVLNGMPDLREGTYAWKMYTVSSGEKGTFVSFVVSDTSTDYPDNGAQDGYWYEKVA